MFTAVASVETDRAGRYLVQLCQHLSQMQPRHGLFLHGRHRPPKVQHVEWTDTTGEMRFQNGTCTLEAHDDALLLRLSAPDEASLRSLQQAISHRLETIGRRAGLHVLWSSTD
jgi:hypothetical protein